jgi:hypothetical protein
MTGLNKAGEDIILLMEGWSGQPLEQVTINLIMVARQQGYLSESQNILVSTSFVDDASEGMYTESIDVALKEAEESVIASSLAENKSNNNSSAKNEISMSSTHPENENKMSPAQDEEEESFQIHRVKTNKEDHSEAKEKGISPGKYSIYLAAVEQGVEIDLEEVKGSSIAQLAQRLNGIGTILSNRPEKQDETEGNKADKAEQEKQKNKENKEQQENKGAKNNQQQDDKGQQNKQDHNQGQKGGQKKQDNKGKESSNKPEKPGKSEEPGSPQIPEPPTNGEKDKKEQIIHEDEIEKLKRKLESQTLFIPGILREIPGLYHRQDKEDRPGVGLRNNQSNNQGNKNEDEDGKKKNNGDKNNKEK